MTEREFLLELLIGRFPLDVSRDSLWVSAELRDSGVLNDLDLETVTRVDEDLHGLEVRLQRKCR